MIVCLVVYTCTRVLLARSSFRVSVVSFCALSAVLRLSQSYRERELTYTDIPACCTLRVASSLFLSHSLSANLDLASILSGCVLFSRVRARRSVASQARGRGERRENARERERPGGLREEKKGYQEPRGSIGGHRPPQKSAHHRHHHPSALPRSSFLLVLPLPSPHPTAHPLASSCPLGPTAGAGVRRPLYKYLPWNVKQFASY